MTFSSLDLSRNEQAGEKNTYMPSLLIFVGTQRQNYQPNSSPDNNAKLKWW